MRKLFFFISILAIACSPTGGGGSGSSGGSTGDIGFGFNPDSSQPKPGPTGECTPGQKTCDGNKKKQCTVNGLWSPAELCPGGTVCSGGVCLPCGPGVKLCQGNTIIQCSSASEYELIETCADGLFCYNLTCLACIPGQKECRVGGDGSWETWVCEQLSANESHWVKSAICPEDCKHGLCINPCQSDIKLNTNQGCDYYAIDLQNAEEVGSMGTTPPSNAQFAVIVSNPSAKHELTVTVHETQKSVAMEARLVPPKGLEIIPLGPRNIFGTIQGDLAWRIKGNRPFVAYQFNPLDNVNPVFSNDASLLLPVNALGKKYLIMTGSGGGAFLTVIGSKSETEVTVTASAATEPGPSIPALAKGESFTTTIGASAVLNIKAKQVEGVQETLTGSQVIASKGVAVFGGNVAATTANRCCADHLEQQLFPESSWGTTYVATRAQPRWKEPNYWRVMAKEDGTQVTFTNGVSGVATLNRGQFKDITASVDFMILADKPIMVGQFLASSQEILPDGVYCTSNNNCSSGVCSSGNSGQGGVCMDTCLGAQSNCAYNEFCLDNIFMGSGAPASGGSCFNRPCGAGLPSCPGNSTCVDPEGTGGLCYVTCFGIGSQCPSPITACTPTSFGDLCVPNSCQSNFQCGNGWCQPAGGGALEGSCLQSCNVQPTCAEDGAACLPGGLSSNKDLKKGLCVSPGCLSDANCTQGHTCVIVAGQSKGSCEPIGDPAFILAVPTEQFRSEYGFLAPNAYKEDYVNIIAPTTAFVQLDGVDVTADKFIVIEGSQFMVARIPLNDGTHSLTASEPVGIVVYGYHDDVSYGYPGGANLFDLGD